MKKGNTMSYMEYVVDHVLWTLVTMACYRNIFFRHITGFSYMQSKILLWGVVVLGTTAGVLLTGYGRRNHRSMIANVLIPFELYTVITYGQLILRDYSWVLAAMGIIAIACFLLPFLMGYLKSWRMFIASLAHGAWLSSTTVAVAFVIVFSPAIISGFLGDALIASAEMPQNGAESKVTIADNIEVVANLREEVWERLTIQERVDTLQVIANIESSYLGLRHELNVGASPMEKGTLAYYTDRNHQIRINIDSLASSTAREALNSICHEAWHAYEHALCFAYESVNEEYKSLLAFENVEQYKKEFSNYKDLADDFDTYYDLECERAAREYACEAVDEYYKKIEYYLMRQGGA